MKKLTTFFFIAFFSLALAATGQAENIVHLETQGETFCSGPCHPVGWFKMTFDGGTTLRGGPAEGWPDPWGHPGDFLFFDLCRQNTRFCDDAHENQMLYLIGREDMAPILTPGLSAGTYGPVTLSGGSLLGEGAGISFQIVGFEDCRVFILVVGEEGASVTVPDGESLSITLFDAQAHNGYMWKKEDENEEEFSVPLEADDNTLELDTTHVEDDGIYLFPESKKGDLLFSGDNVLATLLKAVANAGDPQVIFDEVTLDGSQSQGSDGGPIVSHQWHLEHWNDPAHNRDVEGEKPTIRGLAPGFYQATLTVTDEQGCTGISGTLVAAAGPCKGGASVPYMLLLDDD